GIIPRLSPFVRIIGKWSVCDEGRGPLGKGSEQPRMTLLKIVRRQKLLSLGLLMLTLAIGIMIGTLVNTGVHAARTQSAAPDATPLHVPDRVVLGNEFTKLAKSVDPSVVNITADYTPKASASNPHKKGQGQGGDDQDDDGMDLFRRFFHGDGESPSPAFRRQQSGSGF